MLDRIRDAITDPVVMAVWAVAVALSVALLLWDLSRKNPGIPPLMKAVWMLSVLYSGPLGLWIYWKSGRRQIVADTIWRRGWRSTAHCYSGCGAGEILGLTLAVGVFALDTAAVALMTFCFAYLFGFALTAGPLMQEGMPVGRAMRDAAYSDTASIVVMEIVAIGVDLWLAGDAGLGEALFWSSMVVSLTLGLLAAWPVNVLLMLFGVKEGMHDPRERAHAH